MVVDPNSELAKIRERRKSNERSEQKQAGRISMWTGFSYEIKNHEFTGFATGGKKAIWTSHGLPDDNRIVFCERAIDALSHAVLFPDERTRYASIGGKLNPLQSGLICAVAAVMPAPSTVVAAMDADTDGRKLAEIGCEAVRLAGRSDLRFEMHEPNGFKDWNDQLRAKPKPSLPLRRRNRPSPDG